MTVMQSRVTILSATASLAIVGPATAQRNADGTLASGHLVRAQACSDPAYVQGRVAAWDTSALRLTSMEGTETRIPVSNLHRIRVRGRDRGRWATIGIFAGAVIGGIGYHVWDRRRGGPAPYPIALYIAAPVGALVGGTVGAIGAPEEWVLWRRFDC